MVTIFCILQFYFIFCFENDFKDTLQFAGWSYFVLTVWFFESILHDFDVYIETWMVIVDRDGGWIEIGGLICIVPFTWWINRTGIFNWDGRINVFHRRRVHEVLHVRVVHLSIENLKQN